MIPTWFLTVVTIGVAVMALAMLVQLGLLLGIYLSFRSLDERLRGLMDRQVEPILNTARTIIGQAQKQVEGLAQTVEQISEAARNQLVKVDQLVTEAADRARLQLIRVDEVMADTLNRVEQTAEYIQRNVVRPVQELQAIAHGIRKAVDFMLSRRTRQGPENITQDEELFI